MIWMLSSFSLSGHLFVDLLAGLFGLLFARLKLNDVIHAVSFLAPDHHEQTALVRAVRRLISDLVTA